MTNPTEHFDDELLSAYVDGELTGEELALVKQRLADDPRAQQLVDELRALSQEMQSLPPQVVGDDLRATILQRAERAMLLGTEELQASKSQGAGSSRRWMWPAMALAATLLLTVFLPNTQQEEKPLASAKPVPSDPPREEISLESVGNESDVDSDSIGLFEAQGGGGGGGRDGVGGVGGGGGVVSGVGGELAGRGSERDTATGIRGRTAMSTDSPPAGLAMTEATSKPVAAEVQTDFQVFLTLNHSADTIEPFNRLLVSNEIVLEDRIEESIEPSVLEEEDVGASHAAKRRSTKEFSEEQQSIQKEEVVLVEASTEQIENLLEACNADTQNFASVRLATEQKSSGLPLDKWRQWERSGKQLAQHKLKKMQRANPPAAQSQNGRAMRLNDERLSRAGNGVLIFEKSRNQYFKNDSSSKLAAKSPVQVLFILQRNFQQARDEPASSAGDR